LGSSVSINGEGEYLKVLGAESGSGGFDSEGRPFGYKCYEVCSVQGFPELYRAFVKLSIEFVQPS
jgi:hypothetical protein